MLSSWTLTQITETENNSLLVIFDEFWYQEDIEELTQVIFNILNETDSQVTQIEHTLGADREYSRFKWDDIEFSINFECYSQSCWFELEPQAVLTNFNSLKIALTSALH